MSLADEKGIREESMLPTLLRKLAERDIGLLWLLLFRWLAIVLAIVQSVLFNAVQLAQFSPYIGLLALYTLVLTLLALRTMPSGLHVLRSPWFVCGDALALLLLNIATGGWHSPLYRYSFAALTLLPYVFGKRGLWWSMALLIAWHAVIAWLRTSPFTILLAVALDAITLGALLILSAYALRIVEEQRRLAEENATYAARLRMARYLHDETVQQMYGVILALKGSLRRVTTEPERQHLEQTYHQAVQAWEDLRRYLQDLREPTDDISLNERLRRRAAEFTHLTGLPVHLDITADELALSYESSARLLTIIRAALSNVYRHAQATTVSIRLATECDMLILEIADDGIGFDAARNGEMPGHYGFQGIRERVALMHGTLEIHSQPGEGTRLVIRVPVGNDEGVRGWQDDKLTS